MAFLTFYFIINFLYQLNINGQKFKLVNSLSRTCSLLKLCCYSKILILLYLKGIGEASDLISVKSTFTDNNIDKIDLGTS